ncbi:hypothetical protein HYZ78_03360 [Candidatus Microgenomates bacterium]|nr:hypothetical protein [Candidatus Microgenomates bacterium]
MQRYLPILLIVLAVAGFFYFSGNKSTYPSPSVSPEVSASYDYNFEFKSLDAKKPTQMYVIVASKTQDVRKQLPINLEAFANGKSVWKGMVDGSPSEVCRDATGCGVDGPDTKTLNLKAGDKLEFTATGKDGKIIAKDSATIN